MIKIIISDFPSLSKLTVSFFISRSVNVIVTNSADNVSVKAHASLSDVYVPLQLA